MKKKDKHYDFKEIIDHLPFAWEKLRKHPNKETAGNDNETINTYSEGYTGRILKLSKRLKDGEFKFSPLRRAKVEKGREILVHTIDERILTIAILEKIFPRLADLNSNHDFSREGKYIEDEQPEFEGIPLAVEKIQEYLRQGYIWILEADIKKFFDNVPKEKLFKLVKARVKNTKVLELIRQIIYFSVERSNDKEAKTYSFTNGIAQGSSLSPIFASIYLYEFDMYISEMPDVKIVRYVDDFIILCKDKESAKRLYELAKKKLKDMEVKIYELGEKHPISGLEKTKIIVARGFGSESFDFLGLTFNHTDVDISRKKKEEIDLKIKEIIHDGSVNFLQKTKKIESRLVGYIDHYRKTHYTRTVPSLLKIINVAEDELRSNYIAIYGKIAGRNPFSKLTPEIVDNLFKFIGIDFEYLRRKTKKIVFKKN